MKHNVSLNHLPKELLINILKYLDFKDIVSQSLVCKSLHEHLNVEIYRAPVFPDDVSKLVSFYQTVKKRTDLANAVEFIDFTTVENRWQHTNKVSLLLCLLPNLETLILDACYLHHGELMLIAQSCSRLKSLSLEGVLSTGRKSFCKEMTKVLEILNGQITELNLSLPAMDNKNRVLDDSVLLSIGKYCATSLQVLELRRNIHLDYDILLKVASECSLLKVLDLTETILFSYEEFYKQCKGCRVIK